MHLKGQLKNNYFAYKAVEFSTAFLIKNYQAICRKM